MTAPLFITQPDQFRSFCETLERAPRIAFDTEFVPEYTYSPQLCLIQVATDELSAVIDPLQLPSVEDFWTTITLPGKEIVFHAGKEELNFCLSYTGTVPERIVDVQLAAGLVGLGYPLSYSHLVQRVVGQSPNSSETRTDWRKRPLSKRQIDYALDDVRYLLGVRDRLGEMLAERNRASWLIEEMETLRQGFLTRDNTESWRRVSGSGGLPPRGLAVLREIFDWRDQRARKLDKPPRWIMRDDLVIELSKRQPTSVKELEDSRGLGKISGTRSAEEILEAIERGLAVSEKQLPQRIRRREVPDEQMILKLLSAAMMHLAQDREITSSLLGTNEDVRDLLEWRLTGAKQDFAPRLARGWRSEVCGEWLSDLLTGEVIARIDASSGEPRLVFVPLAQLLESSRSA